jgi:hypothetical protein
VIDKNGTVQQFGQVVLEACESLPTNTDIKYSVAASNDSTFTVTPGIWSEIDPFDRVTSVHQKLVDFGERDEVSIDDVGISYDSLNTNSKLVDPSSSFDIVTAVSGGVATTVSATASSQRYTSELEQNKILDTSLGSDISVAEGTLTVWRNVSTLGSTDTVRDYATGWHWDGQVYYESTIYVSTLGGLSVDFGPKELYIDDVLTKDKATLSYGQHKVKVHTNNWSPIDTTLVTDLTSLKSADALYPYNHRYLIEGFSYPGGYPTQEEQVYVGADIVAEYKMTQVSVFDMLTNVPATDYTKFALDFDAADTSRTPSGAGTNPTTVFLVKVDPEKADFINEKFTIEFKAADTLYKYVRLRAVLQSKETGVSPLLTSYRIKMAN